VLARKLCGHDIVVFRTESGVPAIIDAHCPHMGANMGIGGRVEGEALRCPFHGFRFAPDGGCISTPYGTKIPPKCRVSAWYVREQNGVVLVWHHQRGHRPSFEIPTYELRGWLPLLTRVFTLGTHPQETTENSVDLGHLTEVHNYRDLEILDPLTIDGPYLSVRYAMARSGFGPLRQMQTRAEFRIHVHGLGFSHVEVEVEAMGVQIRHWVLCTPTEGQQCELRVAGSVKLIDRPSRLSPMLSYGPRLAASKLIQRASFHEFCGDLSQDFDIWEHKRHVDLPTLAQGDGPVGRYRQWCRQFYAQVPLVGPTI